MSFSRGYRGTVGGSVQTTYPDQPGVGVPGMLAFASDIVQADSIFVGETDGIAAGRGVIFTAIADDVSLQRPNEGAFLPTVATVLADFRGVVIFDEHMQSDENGVPGWAQGRMARIARAGGRAGARLYVKAVEVIAKTDAVHMCIVAGSDGLYQLGEFCPEALAGTAEAGTSIDVSTKARWVEGADAGDVALLELY